MTIVYRERMVKSALTRQAGGFLYNFTHSLQPYAGCAFGEDLPDGRGCPYCYVRRLPVAQFAGEPWGSWVDVKLNAAEVLADELERGRRRGKLETWRIFMSSATDPYQGAEAKYRVTRACLEAFVKMPPGLLVVQTRSPMVLRDLDLLRALRGVAWVSLTLETNDDRVRRAFTPTSPPVAARLRTLRALRQAGIRAQAAVSPMLPNDPASFAAALADACDRALVDTLFAGDGAHGKRSEALGMRDLFARLGYGGWYAPEAHEPLLRTLRVRLGPGRVAFSAEGFNTLE
jgi:DNA repair photolyase